jgi:hypothetical protein
MDRDKVRLLELWFADKEDPKSAIKDDIKHLTGDEVLDRLQTMNRRLMARCRCLLEVSPRDESEKFEIEISEGKQLKGCLI